MTAARTVSIGVVTQRPWCVAWWTWNVLKQTYRPLEIVVVHVVTPGADFPPSIRAGASTSGVAWQHHFVEPTTCGQLRNRVLAEATGDALCWFDDDDWAHPEKVEWMVAELERTHEPWVGWDWGYLWALHHFRAMRVGGQGVRVSNGAALYRLDAVRDVPYDHGVRSSDGRWIHALHTKHRTRGRILRDARVHSLWTRHDRNTSPGWFGTGVAKSAIIDKIGAAAWGDSSDRFAALAEAFRTSGAP